MAKRPLTRRRILRAALRLIDRDGLDALTMRGLGAALDVEAMALYRHVGSKQRLLEGVAELLLEELALPDADAASWQDTWTALAHSYRRLARSHPGAFRLLALRQPSHQVAPPRIRIQMRIVRHRMRAGFQRLPVGEHHL